MKKRVLAIFFVLFMVWTALPFSIIAEEADLSSGTGEEFDNIQELFASILAIGITKQLKQGICKEYVLKRENISVLRGKPDIHETIKNKIQKKQMLFCEYDEMSENNMLNQVLKTTVTILLRQASVSQERRQKLKKLLLYFDTVDLIEPSGIQWNRIRFHRNNQHYKMLMNICYFVLDGLLLSTDKGQYKMATFLDEQQMYRLYEKFVLEYYRYHYPELHVSSSEISWNVDDDVIDFLPKMKTDITLRKREKILIIDTKYYSRTMQKQYDRLTFHSHHLYQIFTYVKNQDIDNTGDVAGLILYAKTGERILPDGEYMMSGNKISIKTLDLNATFSSISEQLDDIVLSYFGNTKKVLKRI